MKFKITKLDKRHTGRHVFKYYVTPIMTPLDVRNRTFIEWRNWCWENFGPGTERDWTHFIENNVAWGWLTLTGELPRIYFKSDKELAHFSLTFA